MSRADDVGALIAAQFPGVRITSTYRSPSEQAALVAAGKTRATHSQHNDGNGLDMVLPASVSPSQIRSFLTGQGINPGEFLNETGKGKNQGTAAHLHIGLAPKAKGGDPASSGGSTYDRVKAKQSAQSSTLDDLFRARMNVGKAGGMTAQDAAAFDAQVAHGQIVGAPSWYKSAPVPTDVPELPAHLLKAYNSHAMDDDPEARKTVEQAVAKGEVRLPKGQTLKAPPARTVGEVLGMGARAIGEGLGAVGDVARKAVGQIVPGLEAGLAGGEMVANKIGQAMGSKTYAPIQSATVEQQATNLADSLGAAKPESGTEKLLSAGLRAGVEGAAMGPSAAFGGTLRGIGLDALSGATSGLASESARQAGAGPVGQLMAGLAGGLAPVGLAGTAERAIGRARTLPDVVAETPRAAVMDEAGNLTEHGIEVAARHDVTPEQLRTAYETPPALRNAAANDSASPALAREATNDAPVAPEPMAEPTQPAPRPVETVPTPVAEPSLSEPATPAERVQTANEFGVPLTRGQAQKSFDLQDRENRLKNSNGPEGEQMRQFAQTQAEAVKSAVDQFRQAVGDTSLTAEQRGEMLQDAVRELRDNGQKGVTAFYKEAHELGQEVPLETSGIRNAYERLMVEADVPDAVKNVLTQEAARYGIIGKVAGTAENKITTVKIDDGAGGERAVKYYGEPESLRLDNAEAFRQVVSKQWNADGGQKLTRVLRIALDDAMTDAAEKLIANGEKSIPDALAKARAAHVEQVQTFKAKDIVQSIADWKKGAEGLTSAVRPEDVVKKALASVSDLKRIKGVLLAGGTVKSKAAWQGIKAHGLAEIFEKATTRNTNLNGEIGEAISGAKLRTAIEAFGTDKLKVLLDPDQFNQLMKLRRVIEDVTIPISGTVNHSNSGNLMMRLLKDVDNQVTGAFAAAGAVIGGPVGGAVGGSVGRTIAPAIKGAQEAKQAAETLKNATEYTAKKAAQDTGEVAKPNALKAAASATKDAAANTIKAFIDTYKTPRVLAPVFVATQGQDK